MLCILTLDTPGASICLLVACSYPRIYVSLWDAKSGEQARTQEACISLSKLSTMSSIALYWLSPLQIKYETFLEDVNNILTSGEVPNLFPKDELGGVLDELRPAAKAASAGETQEQLMAFFLERVRWVYGLLGLVLQLPTPGQHTVACCFSSCCKLGFCASLYHRLVS